MHALNQAEAFQGRYQAGPAESWLPTIAGINLIHERKAYRGINGHMYLIFAIVSN